LYNPPKHEDEKDREQVALDLNEEGNTYIVQEATIMNKTLRWKTYLTRILPYMITKCTNNFNLIDYI
jgi:hypothetical protein